MSKVVVVTGSSSGVGRATAELLAARGWRVVGLDLNPAEPAPAWETIRCDMRSESEIGDAFAKIKRQTGSLHALVYSAGILKVAPLESMSADDFDAVFAVNMRGAWLCARAALPMLKQAATPDAPTHIVFISSVAVYRPKKSVGAYAASKAALSQLTRVFAGEVASDNVLVNALAPGSMDTPMTRGARQISDSAFQVSDIPPIGRRATTQDTAHAAAMLLGPDSRFITGVTIAVDGGSSAIYVPGGPAK